MSIIKRGIQFIDKVVDWCMDACMLISLGIILKMIQMDEV